MFEGNWKFIAAAIIACNFGSQAFAQTQGCISLKSVPQVEQEVVDANGKKTVQLVTATKVVPGVEVTWTVTADNVCKQPSDKVTINNPVPAHMTFVANSATNNPAADIAYSLDGQTYGTADQLTVQDNGTTRKARADEYKFIRWTFKAPLAPGAQAVAHFRALLN
ncbi:MAG TPA: hypothetical protein VMF52_03090 [Steroidobacteraceae bacterium]|nr:hypothetical protein [Steroidobacteraceae bacterium]